MDIYFLRHGEAGKKAEWSGDDRDRPLTPDGRERMVASAAGLAALDLGVERIVTSPLLRARETAEIAARALGLQAQLDDRLAPGFGPRELAALMADNAGRKALILVGHEPDFSETISFCIGGGRIDCKKGAVARVEIVESAGALRGTLLWLAPPRLLAGLTRS